jgi:hypothetical protein
MASFMSWPLLAGKEPSVPWVRGLSQSEHGGIEKKIPFLSLLGIKHQSFRPYSPVIILTELPWL